MESSAATRVWRVSKAAHRPFPSVSEDDVIDFLVAESVALRVAKEDQEVLEQEKKKEWKKGHKEM